MRLREKKTEAIFKNNDISTRANLVPRQEETLSSVAQTDELMTIPFVEISTEAMPSEEKLVEITDNNVLAHIDHLLPGFVQTGVAVNTATQAAKAGILYQAFLPAGKTLANSTTMDGAVRGFSLGASGGIDANANFMAVNQGATIAANTAVVAMNVASLVVGQYYMGKINSELETLNSEVVKIQDFFKNQLHGEIFSYLAEIKDVTDNLTETLENPTLCNNQINRIVSLETRCGALLGQVNEELQDYSKKTYKKYKDYEKDILEVQNWFNLQKILMEAIGRIADLKYALYLGGASRDFCNSFLETHIKRCQQTQNSINNWHRSNVVEFGIDTYGHQRERKGADKVVHVIPSKITRRDNCCDISEDTAIAIRIQQAGNHVSLHSVDLYDQEVQLFSKDGKVYYLPQ